MLTQQIPIKNIRVVHNHRKTFNPQKHDELVASIKSNGLIQPLVVRPHDSAMFELVCGERRLRAVTALGWTEVSCSVTSLSDEKVSEIQIIENAQRENVPPLEEAAAIADLQTRYDYSFSDIAEKLGKSVTYVATRARLVGLVDEAKELLANNTITVGAAVKLSVLTAKEQKREVKVALKQATEETYETKLNSHFAPLNLAPFDPEDGELLANVGKCSDCKDRVRTLFQDPAIKDTCPNNACFKKKCDAAWGAQQRRAIGSGLKVLSATDAKAAYASGSGFIALDEECALPDGGKSTWAKELTGTLLPDPVLARNPRTLHAHELYPAPDLLDIVRRHRPSLVDCNPNLEVPVWAPSSKAPPAPPSADSDKIRAAAEIGRKLDFESVVFAIARVFLADAPVSTLQALGFYGGRDEAVNSLTVCQDEDVRAACLGSIAAYYPNIVDVAESEFSPPAPAPATRKPKTPAPAPKKQAKAK